MPRPSDTKPFAESLSGGDVQGTVHWEKTPSDGAEYGSSSEACESVEPGESVEPVVEPCRSVLSGVDALKCGRSAWAQNEQLNRLEQKLLRERASLVQQVHQIVDLQLTQHHKLLLSMVQSHEPQIPFGHRRSSGYDTSGATTPPPTERRLHRAVTLASGATLASSLSDTNPVIAGKSVQTSSGGDPNSRTYKSKFIQNLSGAKRTRQRSLISWVVSSTVFEVIVCVAILLNVLAMVFEVQYVGCRVSRQLNVPDCHDFPGEHFLNASIDEIFTFLAIAFSTFFVAEFVLRSVDLGRDAMKSGWMWFDGFIMSFGLVDTLGRLGTTLSLGVNPTAMRAARIMRMLRMLKFIKAKESFHTLFLMMKSITASRHVFVCSVLILYFMMTCFGLVMNQVLFTYLTDTSVSVEDRQQIYELFGTYTRMIITMFELTLGNWAPPSRELMARVSQWWGLFVVIYRCVFCFALVNVTAAVFITETSRVAVDDEVQMLRKSRAEKRIARTLTEVFLEMDTSCDGYLTVDELESAMTDPVVSSLLETLDLQVQDIEELFNLMDDGTGMVQQSEFNKYIMDFRGPAKSMKQVAMMGLIKNMETKLDGVMANIAHISNAMMDSPLGRLTYNFGAVDPDRPVRLTR